MTVISRRSLISAASAAEASALAAGFLGSRSGAAFEASSAPPSTDADTVPPTSVADESSTIPDTVTGRELASWVDAVYSHDPEKLIAYYEAFGMGDMAEGYAANDLFYVPTWGALTPPPHRRRLRDETHGAARRDSERGVALADDRARR